MLYLAWDREINISLFFCDVFVWKWGPRPRTSSRCYHGNKSAATFKKGIFVHPPWVPNCMQNLKGGWKFSFPKMFDSYRDLFLITWLISVREESSFFNFFPVLSPGSPSSVSLEKSVVCGLLLSEGRAFPFFTWFCLSWVVSPIWAVVIWRQNLSFFFHLVLSLLGSQSFLGCCYLKAEPFPFFSPGSVSLG